MVEQKKSLTEALQAANRGPEQPRKAVKAAVAQAKPEIAAEPAASAPRKDRAETKHFGVYIDPAAHKQLKRLALDQDTSLQNLGIEAVNMLFEKYGEPAIATPNKPKRSS